MESFGGSGFSSGTSVTKKRRSAATRRPRPDSQFVMDGRDLSPRSSSTPSDTGSKPSPGKDVIDDSSFRKKEYNLNSSGPKASSFGKTEGVTGSKKARKDDKKYGNLDDLYGYDISRGGRSGSDLKRCNEGVSALDNRKSFSKSKDASEKQSRSLDGHAGKNVKGRNTSQVVVDPNGPAENKLKVKLKVGGVSRTIHTTSENDNDGGSSAKPVRSSDLPRHRQKLILQDSDDDENDLQGVPWKDFNSGSFAHRANEVSGVKVMGKSSYSEQTDKPDILSSSEAVRKSKRVPKRRVLDGAFDDGGREAEVQYLERLKTSKADMDHNVEYEDGEEGDIKKRKISEVFKSKKTGYDIDEDYGLLRSSNDRKNKPISEKESDDTDYVEEEEPGSDGSDDGSDANRRKQKEVVDVLPDARTEPLTTRQRALQSGKGASVGGSFIEFPDGLPPVAPRKQRGKLSEEEQQAKRAEAAQRRRLLVKKQAEELEAEAIKKILGQDSTRKKKEEKERKERDEKAQRKAAESLVLASSTIRWVMGPAGTVVTFADDVGLPSIFSSKLSSYPPPREKCAGPSCTNTYKYRDSKLNLPLCSLHCYKAIQGNGQSVSTC